MGSLALEIGQRRSLLAPVRSLRSCLLHDGLTDILYHTVGHSFHLANPAGGPSQTIKDPTSGAFTLSCKPGTDLWSKPSSTAAVLSWTAPILYTALPIGSFKRARVTISCPQGWTELYDQGGLALVLLNEGEDASLRNKAWIKAGIEVMGGVPRIGVVTTPRDGWSDWSLHDLPGKEAKATLEILHGEDESLWIYVVDGDNKAPVREVTWAFHGGETVLWVGVYTAKPSEKGGDLAVRFEDFVVEA